MITAGRLDSVTQANSERQDVGMGSRLQGKVAIVTGGGSRAAGIGNGRATAILFAREGARVLVLDQNLEAAAETVAMIDVEGGEALPFSTDVTSFEACGQAVDLALSTWGRLDILHNNVGIEGAGTILETDEAMWDHVWTVNTKSMMLMSKSAIPAMIDSGGGAIVNISSISALRPRGLTPYTVSKGAVIALTSALAIDHAGMGIRVNCIVPGPMYTPMVTFEGMDPEVRERRRKASPLGIEGTGWDIANAAVYLASDEARYVTGIVLPVDGGVSLTSAAR
jgi:NAD(P)-dependent dehydrogenase (short-subunit alcohol dehydrogenase family)